MDHQTNRPELTGPPLRVVSAVLYVSGLTLMVTGSAGAFLWPPAVWSAAVGFVLIAAAFAISGGRF